MEHNKTHHQVEVSTPQNTIVVEGPVSAEILENLHFHEKLVAFRPPEKQKEALIKIARFPEGRIIIARDGDTVVGYCTFLYPDALESWSEGNMKNLLELGAIEVVSDYRGCSIGKNLLHVSMLDDAVEDYIIISTEYYWHWDLRGSGLSVWEYRDMMERMVVAGDFIAYATDDPEICSHPANCLMVRVGKRVDKASIEKFDELRFSNRSRYA